MFRQIAVEEIMQAPVETIGPAESIQAAADSLSATEIGSLVVCERDEPSGILTAECAVIEQLGEIDILLRVNAEESRPQLGVSGLQSTQAVPR